MFSGFFFSSAKATSWPNLPSVSVTMKVDNGTSSYYLATLSSVPLGYDVSNAVYPNWCVDRRYVAIRNASVPVLLYSSLAPPANLSSQRWDAVNYILDHKQGSMKDIQDSIWYFVKMSGVGWWTGSTPSATSEAIVADATANGTGYSPKAGQLLAVICDPQATGTQITVIEAQIPQPVLTVGGYSYVLQTKSSSGYLSPSLTSAMILAMALIAFNRTKKSVQKGNKQTSKT